MISIIENFFSRKQNENLELKKKKEQSKKKREKQQFSMKIEKDTPKEDRKLRKGTAIVDDRGGPKDEEEAT